MNITKQLTNLLENLTKQIKELENFDNSYIKKAAEKLINELEDSSNEIKSHIDVDESKQLISEIGKIIPDQLSFLFPKK